MEIQTEYARIVVAGGAESMSRSEFYIPGELMKWGVGGGTDSKWGFSPRNHGSLALWGLPLTTESSAVVPGISRSNASVNSIR